MAYKGEHQISEANIRRLFNALKDEYKQKIRVGNETLGVIVAPLHMLFKKVLLDALNHANLAGRKTLKSEDVSNAVKQRIVAHENHMARASFVRYVREIIDSEGVEFKLGKVAVDALQAVYERMALKILSAAMVHAVEMGMKTITQDHLKMVIKMKNMLC